MTDGAVVLCVNMGDTLHVVTDIIQVITVNSIYFHLKSFLVSRVTVNICFGDLFFSNHEREFLQSYYIAKLFIYSPLHQTHG